MMTALIVAASIIGGVLLGGAFVWWFVNYALFYR